jgi:putative Mg2+ transporter-C (MgtC) family protein
MSLGQMVLRLLVAIACGGLIGLERERGDRPAGFRTNILVTMGAALFTILSITAFPGSESARIAAQVVVGIGFLGAGVIILYGGTLVVGITTAATLWASAAVGMAAGAGFFGLAGISTAIILVVLVLFYYLEDKTISRFSTHRFYLTINGTWEEDITGVVKHALATMKAEAEALRLEETREKTCERSYLFRIKAPARLDMATVMTEVMQIEGVVSAKLEE